MSYFKYNEDERSRGIELELGTQPKKPFTNDEIMQSDCNDPARSFPGTFRNNPQSKGKTFQQSFLLFLAMAKPYYRESKKGGWLFCGMIVITLIKSAVSVMFSFIGKDFWNALSSGDADAFYSILWVYAIALLLGAPVSVLYRFQRERLAVDWREWMTDRVFKLYTSNRVYYKIGSEIDNPDQRMAEDVSSFTGFSLTFFLTVLTSTIDLTSFSIILYSIQPQLFIAIILYAFFGTLTTAKIGKPLVKLNFDQLQKEADFRYSLVRFRDNAESIAFYRGEEMEGNEVSRRLDKVVENRKNVIGMQRNLEFFTTSYNYFVQILPVWVVAPLFFAGTIELGVVSQSAGAFNHILSDLSIFVNEFEQLSAFSAAIDRLSSFMEAIKDADGSYVKEGVLAMHTLQPGERSVYERKDKVLSQIELNILRPMGNSISSQKRIIFSIQNLFLSTPDQKRTLISNLSMSIAEGCNLLITGNSGAGKSSLLRAIAGLWTSGSGVINRPSDNDIYFLPQKPYCCALGSLKDQLLYPSMDTIHSNEGHILNSTWQSRPFLSDRDILDIFDKIDLAELPLRAGNGNALEGLSVINDWGKILSLGEQQRLAFGRILVNQPLFVLLDEATSALDTNAEKNMYSLLNGTTQKITYVSVGHRPSLLEFHASKLTLKGIEGHSLEDIHNKFTSTSGSDGSLLS